MIYCSWAGRMPCPKKYKFYHRSLIYRKNFARPKIQIIFNFIGEFVSQDEFIPDKKEIPQEYL